MLGQKQKLFVVSLLRQVISEIGVSHATLTRRFDTKHENCRVGLLWESGLAFGTAFLVNVVWKAKTRLTNP